MLTNFSNFEMKNYFIVKTTQIEICTWLPHQLHKAGDGRNILKIVKKSKFNTNSNSKYSECHKMCSNIFYPKIKDWEFLHIM